MAADPASALIATDYDGTLAPIVDDPAMAVAAPGAVAALKRLAGRVGTVAVITGRAAADAVALGGLADVPGLIVLGHYGAQRWQGGVLSAPSVPPGVQAAREALPGLLAAVAAPAGTAVEDKGTALAVHTRQTADPAAALALLREPLRRLADGVALTLEPGRLVLELRPPGADKGTALLGLAAERAAGSVLFSGDDLGDLAAFAAIRRLRTDGIPGCAVASESTESPQVAEAADLVVDGPAGIVRFLSALAANLLGLRPGCCLLGGRPPDARPMAKTAIISGARSLYGRPGTSTVQPAARQASASSVQRPSMRTGFATIARSAAGSMAR
jgi:trehalose 6-phosphate phosphatase